MIRVRRIATCGAAIAMLAGSVAFGQAVPATPPPAGDSALEARTSAVASQLRCPVCQGLSIQDSPAELAQSMRALVRDQLAAGKTPEEVEAYFISKYGEWILLAPKPTGFNLLAYGLPVLAVLVGGLVIALAVRRWTSVPVTPPSESAGSSPNASPAINVTEDAGR